MTDRKRAYKRREWLSSPGFQGKIIAVFGLLAVLYIASIWRIAGRVLSAVGAEVGALDLSVQQQRDLSVILLQQHRVLSWQLGVFTFLCVFVMAMGGVVLSHRIGGPLYQLRRYLDGLTDGTVKPRRIRFRKHDFLHNVADAFNRFQESRGMLDGKTSGPPA